jgi:hypothetical protein
MDVFRQGEGWAKLSGGHKSARNGVAALSRYRTRAPAELVAL